MAENEKTAVERKAEFENAVSVELGKYLAAGPELREAMLFTEVVATRIMLDDLRAYIEAMESGARSMISELSSPDKLMELAGSFLGGTPGKGLF